MSPMRHTLLSDMAYKLSAITAKLNPNSTNSTQPIPPDKQKNNKIDKKLKQQQISTFCVPCDTYNPPAPRNPYVKPKDDTHVSFQHNLTAHNSTDFIWVGTRIHIKPKHTIRLWSQNVNGIDHSNNIVSLSENLHSLARYDIQFFGFTETNLNMSNPYIRDTLAHVVQDSLPASRMIASSTKTDNTADYRQFGGTLSISGGSLSTRVAATGRDIYGRFTWTQYFGKKSHLKIYNVYSPVRHSDNSKHDSAVWVQQRLALQQDDIHVEPIEHLLQTLLTMVDDDLANNRQVLIMGDFNTNIFNSKLNDRFAAHSLINAVKDFVHTETTARSWFRGRHLIDGVWCTQSIRSNISSLGYAPFTFEIHSDHRGMYVDFNAIQILDENDAALTPLPYRRLRSSIPKRVQKYVDAVGDSWFIYNIYDKVNQLEDSFKRDGPTETNIQLLNAVDDEIGKILQLSEIKCCNVSRHDTSFYSKKLSKAVKQERLIKGQIRRESMRLSFKRATPIITSLLRQLKVAKRDKRDAKRDDIKLREQHLDECAEQFLRDNPGREKDNVVKMLKHIEKQKREAARIRLALKGKFEGGLTYVLVPSLSAYDEETRRLPDFDILNMDFIWDRVQIANGHDVEEWDIVSNKESVERLSLECLKKHFGQSQGTPFTSDFWIDTLTNEQTQDQILHGTFDLSKYPKPVQLYLKALRKPGDREDIKFEYNFKQFCSFVSKSHERTSTSPSGRHYGHYKVLLKYQKPLLNDIYRIMNMAFSNGVLLNRYKKTITTLICKEKGRPRIHRLRPIHIIEAELQAITKSQWAKSLIKKAEKDNEITDSQYGGRANRQAQSAVLNKVLIFDLARHLAKPMISVDEDLKANYDRELAPLGALEDRYFGLTHEHGQFLVQTTQQQQFFVKTSFGVSDNSYSYSPENKIWGLGQGIAWAGARWLLTSSLIDRIMTDECNGLKYRSPDGRVEVEKLTDMFVDDLNQYCNNPAKGKTLVSQVQHNVQLHSDLAYTSGGCIALDKSKFFHLDFYFDDQGVSHLFTKDALPTELTIQSAIDGVPVEIEQLDINEKWRSLGYFINPTGSQARLLQCVRNYVDDWCSHIRSSKLFPNEIILSYFTVLVPQVTYRLAASSFTYEQCDALMKPIFPILLNAYGFHRHFSRIMATAPFQYGGLNITHFFDIQGKQKLKFLTMHLKRNDTTGKLIKIAMQNIQVSVGSSSPFYTLPFEQYNQLIPDSWLKQIFEYLDSRQISCDFTNDCTFAPQRQHDLSLMELLAPHFTSSELVMINRIRIHLQLYFLSDVTDINGSKLIPCIRQMKSDRTSTWEWPTQSQPKNCSLLWNRVCKRICLRLETHRLGAWYRKNQCWKWKCDVQRKYLEGPDGTYARRDGRYGEYYEKSPVPDNTCFPCDTDIDYTRKRIRIMSSDIDIVPSVKPSKDIYGAFFEDHTLPRRVEKKIARLVRKGRVIYGSDATVQSGKGAFAWGLMDKCNNKSTIIKYHAPFHGHPDQTHSTRGELFGLLGCLRHIWYISQQYYIPKIRKIMIYVYTDSMASIKIAGKKLILSTKNSVENDADIKAEVQYFFSMLRDFVDIKHVKAHQDEQTAYSKLSYASQLNVIMDEFADSALTVKTKIKHSTMIPHLPAQAISFRSPHERLTRHTITEINRAKIGHEAENYLKRRWSYDDKKMKTVLWKELGTVMNSVPFYRKMQYSRILHKQWPTMKRNLHWKFSDTDKCPLCTTSVEDRAHILLCKDELAVSNRDKLLIALKNDFIKIHTDPFLANHIIRILRQFHSGVPVSKIESENYSSKIERYRNQLLNIIIDNGVDNLLSGVITADFSDIQQHHIDDNELNNVTHITKWNRSFIHLILDYTNNLWLYRCTILHSKTNLQRDKLIRSQAIELLRKLRGNPFLLPHSSRDLSQRSASTLMAADLSSVRNWIARVSVALDLRTKNAKLGLCDIRDWLNTKSTYTSKNLIEGGYFMPGCTVDYDSDETLDFFDRYPDECVEAETWDCNRSICSHSSLRDRFTCLTCFYKISKSNPRST